MTLSIDRRAALWGDRTAIVDVSEDRLYAPAATVDRDRIGYDEFAATARGLAAGLSALGIDPGDVVCSLTRTRVAALALAFACRRRGATYAPISHRLTPATVSRPFDRLDPALVVHEPAQRDLVRPLSRAETATFEDVLEAGEGDESEVSDGGESAGDGGSRDAESAGDELDGAPLLALHGDEGRAVASFSERAVERNCVAAAATWGLGRRDRVLPLVPPSTYDGLLRIALPALYVGATLVIDRAFDPGDALAAVERERATVLAGRAAEFRELAERDGFDAVDSLEWAVTETAVDAGVRDAFLERGIPLARAHGSLACPNALGVLPDRVADDVADDRERLGRPVLDCRARLVDDGSPVSGAGTGRLELSGPATAREYADGRGAAADRNGTDDRGAAGADGSGREPGEWIDAGDVLERDESGEYYRP